MAEVEGFARVRLANGSECDANAGRRPRPVNVGPLCLGVDRMEDTITMYRPTGPKELELLKLSGFRRWPPRLPEQPIFYPVTNERYAVEIASQWNVRRRCGVCHPVCGPQLVYEPLRSSEGRWRSPHGVVGARRGTGRTE